MVARLITALIIGIFLVGLLLGGGAGGTETSAPLSGRAVSLLGAAAVGACDALAHGGSRLRRPTSILPPPFLRWPRPIWWRASSPLRSPPTREGTCWACWAAW